MVAHHESLLEAAGGLGLYQCYCLAFYYLCLPIFYANEAFMVFGGWMPGGFNGSHTLGNSTDIQFHSVVLEWNLVGDLSYVPALMTTLQMVGQIFGPIVWGQLSDLYGRKPSILSGLVLMLATTIGSAFCRSWSAFAVLRFFIGVFTAAAEAVAVVLVQEVILPKHRLLYTIGSWPLAGIILAVVAKVTKDWRLFTIIMQVPGVLFLLAFGIWESPKWLAQHGRIDRAKQGYRHIASWNRVKDNKGLDTQLEGLLAMNESQKAQAEKKYMYWDVFYSRKAAIPLSVLFFGWLVLGMTFYGLLFNVSELSGDVALNTIYVMVASLVAKSSQPLIDYYFPAIGRRGFYLSSLGVTLVSLVFSTIAFMTPLASSHPIALTISAIIGLSIEEVVWTTIILSTIEMIPTELRNMGLSAGMSVARIGAAVSPQVLLIGQIWAPGPSLIFSILCAVWLVTTYLFIPETRGKPLPDMPANI